MITAARTRVATLLSLCRALRGREALAVPGARRPGWEEIVALALDLDVAPSLWLALQASGQTIPASPAERLQDNYRGNTVRNLRLRRDLAEAVQALNRVEIIPMLLKGALELVDGTWERPGERWMVDLDLAVPRGRIAPAFRALEGLGYRAADVKDYLHPHETPLVRGRSAGPIEVHVELGTDRLASVLPAAEAWSHGYELTFDGARARALAPTAQVLHNILHAAVQDRSHAVGGLPLKQLVTLTALARVHGSDVDWDAIRRRMESQGLGRALRAHLWLASRLTGMPIPAAVPCGVRERLHELRVLVGFGLPWLTETQRNVRFVLGPEYLHSLYPPGRGQSLVVTRMRHIAHVVRRDRLGIVRRAAERKM
jgi:hypothetical protein